VTTDRDRVLSQFIDAWNAGRRPDVDAYLERVPAEERPALAEALSSFLTWAPTPRYSGAALGEIAAEPAVRAATSGEPWAALLPPLRRRAALSTAELAARVVDSFRLPPASAGKTERYLARMEAGELAPAGVSRRLLEGLARILGVPARELEAAGDLGAPAAAPPAPAPARFRAAPGAADAVREDLELLADALSAAPAEEWDEVDVLFRGGR
jgi:hypothetical protein